MISRLWFEIFSNFTFWHVFCDVNTRNLFPKIVRKKKSRGCALITGLRLSPLPRWALNVWPQWCWITRTVQFARTFWEYQYFMIKVPLQPEVPGQQFQGQG